MLCKYPPTPADARGSAPGNKTFDSCRTTTATATATATATPTTTTTATTATTATTPTTTTTTTTGPFWKPDACSLEPPMYSLQETKKEIFCI